MSPFTIFNSKEPVEVEDIKKYIEVINKLVRRYVSCLPFSVPFSSDRAHKFSRYKYLQKPLEESALPGLLQYIHRWEPAQKDKLATAIGLLMSQGLANASCLQSLAKDHLVKNGQFSLQNHLLLMHIFTLFFPRRWHKCPYNCFQSISCRSIHGSLIGRFETRRDQGPFGLLSSK